MNETIFFESLEEFKGARKKLHPMSLFYLRQSADKLHETIFLHLSADAIKILYILISKMQEHEDFLCDEYWIEHSELIRFGGFGSKRLATARVKKAVNELFTSFFQYRKGDKSNGSIVSVGYIRNSWETAEEAGMLKLSINKELLPYYKFLATDKIGFVVGVEFMGLKSKVSMKFYELFKAALKEKKSTTLVLPIEYVEKFMYAKCADENWGNFFRENHFARYLKEIHSKCGIKATRKIVKEKKKVIAVEFKLLRDCEVT